MKGLQEECLFLRKLRDFSESPIDILPETVRAAFLQ